MAQFAPHANKRPDIAGSEQEITIMISTDAIRRTEEAFTSNGQIDELVSIVLSIGERLDGQESVQPRPILLKRDDLKLICFEYVWQ